MMMMMKLPERFDIGLTGLSEDMEDFMLEQLDFYSHNYHKFYSSFWKTCVNIWQNGVDLSEPQIDIITREYNKIKKERIQDYLRGNE